MQLAAFSSFEKSKLTKGRVKAALLSAVVEVPPSQ